MLQYKTGMYKLKQAVKKYQDRDFKLDDLR